MSDDCTQNLDPLKLAREGASQDDRASAALDAAYAPADARTIAHRIVFARAYARLLKRYDANAAPAGDWEKFFAADPAVPLAVAAIDDVEAYKAALRGWFDFLNNRDHSGAAQALKDRLGWLYAAAGGLAQALDAFVAGLPDRVALKGVTRNLIATALAPAMRRLIAYYQAGAALNVVNAVAPAPVLRIMDVEVAPFADVLSQGLSADWRGDAADWASFVAQIAPDPSVYGEGGAPDPFVRINHCAAHNLFRSVFDQFLKVYARVVDAAKTALDDSLANDTSRAPHYALFLAFAQLMEYGRAAGNGVTRKHLDFYFRVILGLAEKPAEPGAAHLLAELSRPAQTHDFAAGALFKAGKDSAGKPVFFANAVDFVANKAIAAELRTLYRHGGEPVSGGALAQGRLFASPVANSGDGVGGPLTTADRSWQPFFNKTYVDGVLTGVAMPKAEVGFAVASHYLLAAEGERWLFLSFKTGVALPAAIDASLTGAVECRLTTAKGWKSLAPAYFGPSWFANDELWLALHLTGADEAVTPYAPAVHGANFATGDPLLAVVLRQDDASPYAYARFAGLSVRSVAITASVSGLRSVAAANDFGPLDLSKPFAPFGASPVKGASLVIGAREMFQKSLIDASLVLQWQTPPSGTIPSAEIDVLKAGVWTPTAVAKTSIAANLDTPADATFFDFGAELATSVVDAPDYTGDSAYGVQARNGYFRLRLDGDIGQSAYPASLMAYIRKDEGAPTQMPTPPQPPVAASLALSYSAQTNLVLDSAAPDAFDQRQGRFFHIGPFGTAERHAFLDAGAAPALLPPFQCAVGGKTADSEAEFYIGVAGLAPPQNLSLLFQVADGTANPLAPKPSPHVGWSYLSANHWVAFADEAVVDATGGLLNSGIVALAVPRDANSDNTLLPAGLIWLRAGVQQASDAVCRLRLVAAQAMKAVFADQGNAADFSATPLPAGTISQLTAPDAEVKGVSQPFSSFGGRGAERPQDFYRRVSERLRHKDRAIDLWDYERLVLEAFPRIYKVKCLNHTCYEPSEGGGIYRELAPGHVTLVALPDLKAQPRLDPLKPYVSLGLLGEIEDFLARRTSGFVQLHVKNPQFEAARTAFRLRLRDGYDAAYYSLQLQQAITRFLSPWAFDGAGAPSFGGRIAKSTLVHFVESQPYVDYVTDFQLFVDVPGQPPGATDLDEAEGSRAVSILVSSPASKHQITLIEAADAATLAESCGCDA